MPYGRSGSRGLNFSHYSSRMYPNRCGSPCRTRSNDECNTPTVQVNINTKDDDLCDDSLRRSSQILCENCDSLGHWCGKCEHRNYFDSHRITIPCNTCASLGHWCGKCQHRNYFSGHRITVPCNTCTAHGRWCGKCKYRSYFDGHHITSPCNTCTSLGHWCGKCQYRNYFGGHHITSPCNTCSSLGHWCGKCQYRSYFGGHHITSPCNTCSSLGRWCGKCQYRSYFGGHHITSPCNTCSSLGHWCGKCQYRSYFGGHHITSPCNTCTSLGHWCGKCQYRSYFGGHHITSPCTTCTSLGHWCGQCRYQNYFDGHHITSPCNKCTSLRHWCGKCQYRNYFDGHKIMVPCSTCTSLGHWCGKCQYRNYFDNYHISDPCSACSSLGHWCGKCQYRNYFLGRQVAVPCNTCSTLGRWCGRCDNRYYRGKMHMISPCNTCISMGRWCGKCRARNYFGGQQIVAPCHTCESLGHWCGKCEHGNYYNRHHGISCNTCKSLGHWCGKCENRNYHGSRNLFVPCNACSSLRRWCGKCENRHYFDGGQIIGPCSTCLSLGHWCGKCGLRNYYGVRQTISPCSTCESLGYWCGRCNNSFGYVGRLASGFCSGPQEQSDALISDDTSQFSTQCYGLPTLDDSLAASSLQGPVNQACYSGQLNVPQFYGHGSDGCIPPEISVFDANGSTKFSEITRPSSAPECTTVDECTDSVPVDTMDPFYDHLRAGSDHNLKEQNLQNFPGRSSNQMQLETDRQLQYQNVDKRMQCTQKGQNAYHNDHKSSPMECRLSKCCFYPDKRGNYQEMNNKQYQNENINNGYTTNSNVNINEKIIQRNKAEMSFQNNYQTNNDNLYNRPRNSIDINKKRIFQLHNDISKTKTANEDSSAQKTIAENYNAENPNLKKRKDVRFDSTCDTIENHLSAKKQSVTTSPDPCTHIQNDHSSLNNTIYEKIEKSIGQDNKFNHHTHYENNTIQPSIKTDSPNVSNNTAQIHCLFESQLKNSDNLPNDEKINKELKDCGTQFSSTNKGQDLTSKLNQTNGQHRHPFNVQKGREYTNNENMPKLNNSTNNGNGFQMNKTEENYFNMNPQNINFGSRIPQRKTNSHDVNSYLPPSRIDEYMGVNSRLHSLHNRSSNNHNTYTDSVRENLYKILNESHLASRCDYYIKLLQQKDCKKSLENIHKFSSIRDLTEVSYRNTLQLLYDTINKVNACSFKLIKNCQMDNESKSSGSHEHSTNISDNRDMREDTHKN